MELGKFELCLNVANLAKSVDFYEKLGFSVVRGYADEGWLVLDGSGTTIALYQGHIPANQLNFRGQDIFELSAKLEENGLRFNTVANVEPDGTVGAVLLDPDGNQIYLNT
jgi:lactoylglutathione lyase